MSSPLFTSFLLARKVFVGIHCEFSTDKTIAIAIHLFQLDGMQRFDVHIASNITTRLRKNGVNDIRHFDIVIDAASLTNTNEL